MVSIFHTTGILKGTIQLPSSKSISNRALIIREIGKLDFSIDDLSQSTDTLTLFKHLLAKENVYDCVDGGTTFRFLLALKVLTGEECIITGSDRLQHRPVKPLVDALITMGADISYLGQEGYPPIKILTGLLKGHEVSIDASVSSQFISALMMIAPKLEKGLKILLNGKVVSWEYILLTKKVMAYFGVEVFIESDYIYIPNSEYKSNEIVIEKDWSAASYWFEAAALSKEADLFLDGLFLNSMQGDEMIVTLTKPFGIEIKESKKGLRIIKIPGRTMNQKFTFDFINHPDLVLTMAFLCAAKGIDGNFSGIQSLRIKETNRVKAIAEIVTRFGFEVTETDNSISFKMINKVKECTDSLPVFNDHRMAMSIAPLCLSYGKLKIEDQDVVKKSYPSFWEELKKVGFQVS